MRLFLSVFLLLALTVTATAQRVEYSFEPGKRLGPIVLGQTPDQMLAVLEEWTFQVEPYTIGDVYHFPAEEPSQFSCGFSKQHVLREITISDRQFTLQGHSKIGPGTGKDLVLQQFGEPSTDTTGEFGGYLDYDSLGICFHFPSARRDPAPYGEGNVGSITLYVPGTSRFKEE